MSERGLAAYIKPGITLLTVIAEKMQISTSERQYV